MFSSFYTHVVLVVSCVIFSCSFISFVKRIQTTNYLTESSINQPRIRALNNDDKNRFDEQTNDKLLREKVLGSDKTLASILHRFTFLNPPKSVCSYSEDTEHLMIIIVLSRALNFDYRQAIRGTWGVNGEYEISRIHIQTIFFVGIDDSVRSAIRDEQTIFNDVIEIGM
jgi:hypothetical protein